MARVLKQARKKTASKQKPAKKAQAKTSLQKAQKTSLKSKKSKPKSSVQKVKVEKVTKKVISKVAKKTLTAEEKEFLRLQREQTKLERERIRQERQRIKDEKERVKAEKLAMWELHPNNKIPLVKENPYFGPSLSTKHKVNNPNSDCCVFCNNREAILCVKNGDIAGLKKVLADTQNVSNPFQKYSIANNYNLVKAVVQSKNLEMFKMVIDYLHKESKGEQQKRVKLPKVALDKMGTGVQNVIHFNFQMRSLNLSRGGKDGNNAFTYDNKIRKLPAIDYSDFLKLSPPESFVNYMLSNNQQKQQKTSIFGASEGSFMDKQAYQRSWGKACRRGDFATVRKIFKAQEKHYNHFNLSRLHFAATLQGDEAEKIKILSRNALLKQSQDQFMIVPGMIACINPDPTALRVFFRMYPTSLQTDVKGRDLIHYAVMNANPDILEFLIEKRQMINTADQQGLTPLMMACKYGKVRAVNQIIEEQKRQIKTLDKNDKDYDHYQSFYTYVNSVGPYKCTPLHFAIRNGSLPIVRALVEAGADIEAKNFYNDTPLSVAAQFGHLDIAGYLLTKGANIHGVDKQQRTPLIRACQNGQVHIVNLCLRLGVNANFCDSSENTALHHACAYGWLNVVKMLVEDGKADINRLNEWKSSPTIIAMLKGHYGIVDYLLSQKDIDASLVDDQGRSLLSQLCLSFNEDSFNNMKFLLKKNKIDAKSTTNEGYSALHFLCSNDVYTIASDLLEEEEERETKPSYFMKGGKRLKSKNHNRRRYYYNNSKINCLKSYRKTDEEQKQFDKLVLKLKQVQIKCAELLISAGCDPNALTEEDEQQLSPLSLAVKSHSYDLALFLLRHSDQFGSDKDDEHKNILHYLARDITHHPEAVDFLQSLVNKKLSDVKRLAQLEDHEGQTPFHKYFTDFKQFIQDVNSEVLTTGWRSDARAKEYFFKNLFPQISKSFDQMINIYSCRLQFDITRQIGMTFSQKEEAKELLANHGIKQGTYDKLISLQLKDQIKAMKEVSEDDSNKTSKARMTQYGYVVDPAKSNMGLIKLKFLKDVEEDEDQNNNSSGWNNRQRGRNRRFAKKKAARRPKKRSYDSDEDDEEEEEDENNEDDEEEKKDKKFDPTDFYNEGETLKNVLHLMIESYTEISNDQADSHKKQICDLYDQITVKLLKSSKAPIKGGSNGFDQHNSEGENALFQALNSNLISLANKIIESGVINLTLQQKKTGLTPIHLLAALKESETNIENILKLIDKKKFHTILDRNGNSPLHYAAFTRNINVLSKLHQFGNLDINIANKFGVTPLHVCAFSFNEKKDHTPAIERYLLSNGANPRAVDSDLRTPAYYLFFKGKEIKPNQQIDPAAILMTLLREGGLNVNDLIHADKTKNSLLHFSCMAGANICTLTLLNSGAKLEPCNLIGNTPFSLAMAHQQQQISTFLIQNGCDINREIRTLKENEDILSLDDLQNQLVPTEFAMQVKQQKAKDLEQAFKLDEILKTHKIKGSTPFYNTMELGWGGIGYLLFSKNVDAFSALIGCLQAKKYEKFLDLLDSVDKKAIQMKDIKKRNLLLILLKFLGETDYDPSRPEIFSKAMNVFTELTTKNGLPVTSTDARGYNILHTISLHGCTKTALALIMKLPQKDALSLLNQKATHKSKASPIVLLLDRACTNSTANDIIEFISSIQIHFGQGILSKLPLTLTVIPSNKHYKDIEVPHYLDMTTPLISDPVVEPYETHLALHLLTNPDFIRDLNCVQLHDLFTTLKPFLSEREPHTGMTLLMKLSQANTNLQVFHFLLGSKYFKDKDEFQLNDKAKPIVNVNEQDARGRTALHFAIQPSQKYANKGYRQNVDTIQDLIAKGAKPTIRDKKGVSPLDLVKTQPEIRELLAPHTIVPPALPQKKKLTEFGVDFVRRPYSQDAEEFLESQLAKIKAQEQMEVDEGNKKAKPEVEVDEHEDLANCEVVQSEVLGADGVSKLYYDAAMVKVDVKRGYYGFNAFYVIQILRDKAKDMYLLWTRWGRIGDFGQYQRTPFATLLGARLEFEKVFRQKTGNKWEDVVMFNNIPSKYKLRRVSGHTVFITPSMRSWKQADTEIEMKKVLVNFKKHTNLKKSSLSQAELELIQPLVDSAYVLRKINNESLDQNLFCESALDGTVLKDLCSLLFEMMKTSKEKEKIGKEREDFEAYTDLSRKMFDLQNQYYELSTPTEFAFSGMKYLDNGNALKSEFTKILQAKELEHATQLLLAAAKNIPIMNPYDYVAKNLNFKVKALDAGSDKFAYLMRYINNSFEDSKNKGKHEVIQNVFEVCDSQKASHVSNLDDDFFNSIHQHMMLFHGTTKANLLSILEDGMKIKPKNAAFYNGSAFGEGIYLADDFQFASKYSERDQEKSYFVLVCETALGNVLNSLGVNTYQTNSAGYFTDGNDFAKGYHSVRIMGRQGPDFNQNWNPRGSKEIWPLGEIIKYDQPFYKKNNQEFDSCKQMEESLPTKKREDFDQDQFQKFTQPKQINRCEYSFDPCQVHHFIAKASFSNWGRFNYFLNKSQYLVSNSNQIRVRYIIQVKNTSKDKK